MFQKKLSQNWITSPMNIMGISLRKNDACFEFLSDNVTNIRASLNVVM